MKTINLFLALLLIVSLGQGCALPADFFDDPNYTQDDKDASRRGKHHRRREDEKRPHREKFDRPKPEAVKSSVTEKVEQTPPAAAAAKVDQPGRDDEKRPHREKLDRPRPGDEKRPHREKVSRQDEQSSLEEAVPPPQAEEAAPSRRAKDEKPRRKGG